MGQGLERDLAGLGARGCSATAPTWSVAQDIGAGANTVQADTAYQ
ncbi:hypothetical protein [Marilutibacter maris]|nr:hypothetical protein [Lysobacter maris]